jgi:hypothetical protein
MINEFLVGYPIHLNDLACPFKRQVPMIGMATTPENKQSTDIRRNFSLDIVNISTVEQPEPASLAVPGRVHVKKYCNDFTF